MGTKPDETQNRVAVERWLKKKPQDHFARRIMKMEALGEQIQCLLLNALLPEERLEWMIDLPSQGILRHQRQIRWFRRFWPIWQLTPSWVIALTNRRLLLIRILDDEKSPGITAIPVENILYLEHGIILLFSWLEIHWAENDTALSETLYYDTVNEWIILPLIQKLRRFIANSMATILPNDAERNGGVSEETDEKQPDDLRGRSLLSRLPFKFLNMIPHYGLLEEDQICQVVYRQAQWRKLLGLARVMTGPRMVLLQTDAYLLIASEELSTKEGSYGLTLTFLPLKFVEVSISNSVDQLCQLNIHLEGHQTARDWSLFFPAEMDEEVRTFARQLNGNHANQR